MNLYVLETLYTGLFGARIISCICGSYQYLPWALSDKARQFFDKEGWKINRAKPRSHERQREGILKVLDICVFSFSF